MNTSGYRFHIHNSALFHVVVFVVNEDLQKATLKKGFFPHALFGYVLSKQIFLGIEMNNFHSHMVSFFHVRPQFVFQGKTDTTNFTPMLWGFSPL